MVTTCTKQPQRLPVVLTSPEVKALLGALDGVHWIMASLLDGAGLRLLACLRLRVQDMDVASHKTVVREGKGSKDRRTMLPAAVQELLAAPLDRVRQRHQHDMAQGFGRGLCAGRAATEVSTRQQRMGLAVGVPRLTEQPGPAVR